MHLAASDFRIDLSLNFLSLVVSGAIALALVWYLVLILSPLVASDSPIVHDASGEVGPPAWAAVDGLHGPSPALPAMPKVASVVTVFRCESQGRVTYADRPCEHGGVRVLRLPRQ